MKAFLVAALAVVTLGLHGNVAHADPYRDHGDPYWRHDGGGPRRHVWVEPPPVHRYLPPRREVFIVYPPPPDYGRQVVYVEPVQAVPTSDPYVDDVGRYCREYQSVVRIGGAERPSYGTACRMPDGTWKIVR